MKIPLDTADPLPGKGPPWQTRLHLPRQRFHLSWRSRADAVWLPSAPETPLSDRLGEPPVCAIGLRLVRTTPTRCWITASSGRRSLSARIC
jgi:hypothetical protein